MIRPAFLITDVSAQLSDPIFHLIRSVFASAVLIALFLGIRRALKFFLGIEGRRLGKRKYRFLSVTILLLAVIELPRRVVELELTKVGEKLSNLLPYFEPGWLTGALLGLYYTLIGFLLLLACIQLLGLLYWSLEDAIDAWQVRARSEKSVRKEGAQLIAAKTVRFGNRILRDFLLAILFVIFVPYLFKSFPRTRILVESIWDLVEAPVKAAVGAMADYLPNLGYIFVIALFAWLFLMGLKRFFDAIQTGTLVFSDFPGEWAAPTYSLCRALVLLFVLMAIYPYLPGAKSEFFRGFSVFVGALVTLGSAGAIGNFVAGIVLTYYGAFHVGDIVRIGETFGEVIAKSSFSTRVQTPLNEEVTFANTSVLSASVINYSKHARAEGVALAVTAGIGYDVDWRTVHRLMIAGARRTEHILAEPAPCVFERNLDSYSVQYELRAWTDQPRRLIQTHADLRRSVLDAFNEAGVEIMTPSILGHRDASNLAIPVDKFPQRGRPSGIVVTLETDANVDGRNAESRGTTESAA